jgi:hypothetical protein
VRRRSGSEWWDDASYLDPLDQQRHGVDVERLLVAIDPRMDDVAAKSLSQPRHGTGLEFRLAVVAQELGRPVFEIGMIGRQGDLVQRTVASRPPGILWPLGEAPFGVRLALSLAQRSELPEDGLEPYFVEPLQRLCRPGLRADEGLAEVASPLVDLADIAALADAVRFLSGEILREHTAHAKDHYSAARAKRGTIVLKEQRAWIRARNRVCRPERVDLDDDFIRWNLALCLMELTSSRNQALAIQLQ